MPFGDQSVHSQIGPGVGLVERAAFQENAAAAGLRGADGVRTFIGEVGTHDHDVERLERAGRQGVDISGGVETYADSTSLASDELRDKTLGTRAIDRLEVQNRDGTAARGGVQRSEVGKPRHRGDDEVKAV